MTSWHALQNFAQQLRQRSYSQVVYVLLQQWGGSGAKRSSGNDDQINALVDEAIESRMVSDMMHFFKMLAQGTTAFLLIVLFNVCFDKPRWMNSAQMFLMAVTCALSQALTRSSLSTMKQGSARDLAFVAIMAIFAAFVSFADANSSKLDASWTAVFPFRLLLATSYKKVSQATCCNIAFAILYVSYYASQDDCAQMPIAFPLWREVFFIGYLYHHMHRSLQDSCNELYQFFKASSLHIETKATRSLLNLVCNVVVELDGNLHLLEEQPELSAFLLRSSSTSTFKGRCLHELFREKDRQRVRQHLMGDSTRSSGVGSLYANMKDSMGASINVELFYITFDSMTDGEHYLVGLRETMDEVTSGVDEAVMVQGQIIGVTRRARSLSANKGTPGATTSNSLTTDFGSDAHAEPASAVKTASSTSSLSVTCLKPTSEFIKIHSVDRFLRQWNIQVGRQACCPLHAHIHEFIGVLKKLKRFPCENKDSFAMNLGDEQCGRCGMVNHHKDSDDEADACLWCSSCSSADLQSGVYPPKRNRSTKKHHNVSAG